MKHIKLFESFILEGTGLVTGKHDIDILVDFLMKITPNWKKGRRLVAVIKPKGAQDKDNIHIFLSNGGGIATASADQAKRNITVSAENQDFQYIKMLVAHELSHMFDPGISAIIDKNPNYDYENHWEENHKLTPEESFRRYINDESEREAWPSGLVYVINSLLIKQPEKIEAVKELIRHKDWHMEKVFPELQNIINNKILSHVLSKYGKVRERFFKRLASSIITQKSGEIIDIKSVIIDDSDDETIPRVKPIEPEGWHPIYDYSRGSHYGNMDPKIWEQYSKQINLYNKGIEKIEYNRLIEKVSAEMNIETVTIKSKIVREITGGSLQFW